MVTIFTYGIELEQWQFLHMALILKGDQEMYFFGVIQNVAYGMVCGRLQKFVHIVMNLENREWQDKLYVVYKYKIDENNRLNVVKDLVWPIFFAYGMKLLDDNFRGECRYKIKV